MINKVKPEGNNVKIKWNVKVKIAQIAVLIFCDNVPGFCLVLSEAYS